MSDYFEGYGTLDTQRMMVSDRRRTEAFAAALSEAVQAGDTVIDVGTGTGVLAMLAARAGAASVHAVDNARVVEFAQKLVDLNELSKVVTIHDGLADSLQLEGQADLLVSEWLGNWALTEDMLKDVLAVRDRFLKPGGRMMPSEVQLLMAPIDDALLYEEEGPGFWGQDIHGLDFSILEKAELMQHKSDRVRLDEAALLAPGATLVQLDMATMQSGDEWQEGEVEFELERDGMMNGFAGWFTAQLSPGVMLDTGPSLPWTHWMQIYMPCPPRKVSKGERLRVEYRLGPLRGYHGAMEAQFRIGKQQFSYLVG